MITAPAGWILDNRAGIKQRIPVVFYPKGSSWEEASCVFYARSEPKEGRRFKQFLAKDRADFVSHDPKMIVSVVGTLRTEDGHRATIVSYDSKSKPQYDLVAFIDLPRAFASLCLNSRDYASRESAKRAFRSLVTSFHYVSDDVTIDKGPF